MAKQCKVCTNFYPDHLPGCPHCAKAAAEAESGSSEEAIDVFPEEEELTPDSPELAPLDEAVSLLPEGPKEPPGQHIPGFHGTGMEEGGSSVDLGALGKQSPQQPAVPLSAMLSSKEKKPEGPKSGSLLSEGEWEQNEPVNVPKPPPLMSKATKIAPQTAPRTMLAPDEALDIPAGAPGSMLGSETPAQAPATPASPKATMLAAPGPKPTMLAPDEAEKDATDPKATKLAPQGAQPTMLVQPGEKKTHLAAGAAPTTKLAKPDEMAALAKEGVAAPKTKMSAGAAPMTRLAGAEDQDRLALPEPKKTKIGAGAAPMTKLAKPDEQDQLSVEPPPEEDEEPTYDVGTSSIDLGSTPRLGAGAIVEEGDVVEAEDVVAEGEEVEEEKVVKKRGGVLVGVVGLMLGTAAAIALALVDIIPIGALQESLGIKKKPETIVKPGDTSDLAIAILHLDNGNFPQAIGLLNTLDQNDKTVLSKRGLARWLQYLQKQKGANAPLNKGDSEVTGAQKDLNDAGNAEAKFWLGHMEEMLAGKEAARKVYQEGADKFKDQQRIFQSALDRLDATGEEKGPGAHLHVPLDDAVAAARFNLMMLFAPTFQAGLPQESGEEAGHDFWRAAKLAREQKFNEAVDALKKARTTHDKQRFARLRRAQNPTSDPTEEIFLRACDDLLVYWQARYEMKEGGYADIASALKVLKDNKDSGTVLADVVKQLKVADVKDVPKSLKDALDNKKKADDQLAEIKKALGDPEDLVEAAKKIGTEHKDYSEALTAAAKTLGVEKPLDVPKSVDELAKAKAKFEKDYTDAFALISDIHKQLVAAKAEGVGKDPKNYAEVRAGVKQMIEDAYAPLVKGLASVSGNVAAIGKVAGNQIGQHIDLSASLASSQTSNARYQVLLAQSRTPQQMLDVWLPLLQQSRANKDLAEKAATDARNVMKDKQAPANILGEARCVEGLALRNQGKYDDARKALSDSLKQAAQKGGWATYAQSGHAELTDPNAYYIPLADSLRQGNRFEDALSVVSLGLDAFKDTKKDGQLFAARCLIQLDLAKVLAKGARLSARDARVIAADKDAEAAIAAGARADGFYARGRVAEELGNWNKAHQSYRQALAAAPPADRVGNSRYRVAIARVLLRIPNLPPEEKPEMKGADEKTGALTSPPPQPVTRGAPVEGEGAKEGAKATIAFHPITGLLVQMLLAAPVDQDEVPETPELDEAIRLADEAIRAGNPEGHLVKGLALAKKGRWTEAVLEYSTGLEKLGRNPDDAKGLRFLMQNHPALKIPDGQMPADPLLAEKHYAAGLRHYWARRYDDAEREFFRAVSYYDQDARYLYFLGLARLNQGKRSFALEAFRRAGVLEQQAKPASATVSATLERVQGPDRQTLNRYRP